MRALGARRPATRAGARRRADARPTLAGIDADAAPPCDRRGARATAAAGSAPERRRAALLRAYGIPLAAVAVARHAGRGRALPPPSSAARSRSRRSRPGSCTSRDAGARAARAATAPSAVARAAREMPPPSRGGHEPEGFLVQPMAPPGVEMLVGVVGDPRLRPGRRLRRRRPRGRAARRRPGPPRAAGRARRARRCSARCGRSRCSTAIAARRAPTSAALEDVVVRVARARRRAPGDRRARLNPVVVSPTGAVAVDARVRVTRVAPPPPFLALGA